MMDCNPYTLYQLFLKHAKTKSEARRVYNLVKNTELTIWELGDLLSLKGMGRQGALLSMEVACDLVGKK